MGRRPRGVDFFRVWSAEMAYVLGLWWTDGYMRINPTTGAHLVEIASTDRDHLRAVADLVGEQYSYRQVTKRSECVEVTFCSKELYQDLEALGGTPRKSRTIGFPPVPAELLPHFVRGVVDGDGTLGWNGDRPIIHVYSGSTTFLEQLGAAVEQQSGIPAPNIAKNRDNWYVKWSTTRAKCLAAWLYDMNPGAALPRKEAIARAILGWRPKKRPEQGTVTDAMRRNFPAYLP